MKPLNQLTHDEYFAIYNIWYKSLPLYSRLLTRALQITSLLAVVFAYTFEGVEMLLLPTILAVTVYNIFHRWTKFGRDYNTVYNVIHLANQINKNRSSLK